MEITLVKCCYGDEERGEECCVVTDGQTPELCFRCPVFDWEECPFGKKVEGCGTCFHAAAMSEDGDGGRIVDCEANEMQMYAPYTTECKHWERALG